MVDRSLPADLIAEACRTFGWRAQTLVDVYGVEGAQTAEDEMWINYAGHQSLVVLTKDERIARIAAERAAVLNSQTKVFCIVARRASMTTLVEIVTHHRYRIEQRCQVVGHGFWKVYPNRLDKKM